MIDYSAVASSAGASSAATPNIVTSGNTGGVSLHNHAFGSIGSGLGGGGSGGGTGPPPLDLNEFPSLGGTGISMNTFSQSTISRPAYVGMVKENVTNQSGSNEFNIQSEDFPALPGALQGSSGGSSFQFSVGSGSGSSQDGTGSSANPNTDNRHHLHVHVHHPDGVNNARSARSPPTGGVSLTSSLISSLSSSNSLSATNTNNNKSNSTTVTSSASSPSNGTGSNNGNGTTAGGGGGTAANKIQVTKDGGLTNIPPGMMTDPYGIAGLLAMLHQAVSKPELLTLTVGVDISKINMNLSSNERLYPTFPGPLNDVQLKPYEIDYPVPQEYLVFNGARDKLSPIKFQNFNEDLLFFLFYCCAGDKLQNVAASELYSRDWRFHKDEGLWITRKQGTQPMEQSSNFERGTYIYFDTKSWSKQTKEMVIHYDRLE